jgi:hypothetical protein
LSKTVTSGTTLNCKFRTSGFKSHPTEMSEVGNYLTRLAISPVHVAIG